MLRTMQKARYDSMNVGHFGLAAETYTHFTSPIRRYPDLVVHRLLRELRQTKCHDERQEELDEELPEVGRHTSERERRADEAEREIVQWKKVRFMADKVGDVFDGYITGVAPFGLFVELVEHYVEGWSTCRRWPTTTTGSASSAHAVRREHQEDVSPRRPVTRAGRSRRSGTPADRSRPRRRARRRCATTSAAAAPRAQPRAPEEGAAQGHARGTAQTQAAPRQAEEAARAGRTRTQATKKHAMTHIVVGTAGHIDHGKSTLVQALTGIDPDRLKEEKDARHHHRARFCASRRSATRRVAFVDVPGHERFVRTMLAGVGGIDCVMLIVAADESVMPQTREHFDICRLLRIPRGVVVLTKADLVDDDTRELVRQDVADLVEGSFLEGAPMMAVSARTGEGLDALARRHRGAGHRRVRSGPSTAPRACRSIARSRCRDLAPSSPARCLRADRHGRRARDPARRAQGEGARLPGPRPAGREAVAGQRTAINLGGIDVSDVARGQTLATPGTLSVTRRDRREIDLLRSRQTVTARRARALAPRHRGSARADLGRRSRQRNRAGRRAPWCGCGWKRRRCSRVGDRFILRAYSPPLTIGGGLVLDPAPTRPGIRIR